MKTRKHALQGVGVVLLLSALLAAIPLAVGGARFASPASTLEIIGYLPPAAGVWELQDVQIVGDKAYLVARTGGLQIVSLADLANPQLLSSLPEVGTGYALHIRGNLAFVACL